MFNNINEAINWIENVRKKEARTDLSRITKVLDDFGNPQTNFTKVHIAGTNGKGSVCHILNECLSKKWVVGAFTSPYVISFNERIKIGNEYINDTDLLKYINQMYYYSLEYSKNGDVIPFFEMMFAISLLYFNDMKVDIALIEVGVGGLLDCTNCFDYEVSTITNISFDHVSSLGDTIEKIAAHKLGIVKENSNFYTSVQEELKPFFKKHCRKNKVKPKFIDFNKISNVKLDLDKSYFTYNGFDFTSSLIGNYQINNLVLAIEILNDHFKLSYYEINNIINNIYFNGRMEVLSKKPFVLIDGAHNVDGILQLTKSITSLFNKKVNFCFAAMKDKDTKEMIKLIEPYAKSIYFTQINYHRTTNVTDFNTTHNNIFYYDKIENLMNDIKDFDQDEIVVFTGSLYFISEIRRLFK